MYLIVKKSGLIHGCINNLILFQIIVILKEVHLENIGRENQYGKTANNTV